jgi:DNA anti-recombination protein RmuC
LHHRGHGGMVHPRAPISRGAVAAGGQSRTTAVMSESHSAQSVQKFEREDPDPVPIDPASMAKLQETANLANENCDRAMALAHKLSIELREAQSRINQLELEADGLVDRLGAEAETAVAKLQSEVDARVDRIKREVDERVRVEAENRAGRLLGELAQAQQRVDQVKAEADARIEQIKLEAHERVARAEAEADKRLDRARAELEDRFSRLKADFAQAELRADHAERWLMMIRREIEDHLMPSFAATHDQLTPPETAD